MLIQVFQQFAYGLYDGITGLVMDPIRGHRAEGNIGLAKGMGRGVMGVYWKTTGALAGLLGNPLQGVYKSVYSAIHSRTRKLVAEARREEGTWLMSREKGGRAVDAQAVMRAYDVICKSGDTKDGDWRNYI